ncbi:hypothetical protein B0J12DRAFT_704355 [Macrophomina phaseolina]|uniref:Uncharacterized protein n=1 Tax=Macrophomina phaseolina TaxID=35725 RepID=A0ABQ8FWJ5_9PEZI|nr:hypothetical protein B0J12DRAFT_704355 [Macrophomina phaseolina]
MSSAVNRLMALPDTVRDIVILLYEIGAPHRRLSDMNSWREFSYSDADHELLWSFLRQTGQEDLFDLMRLLRTDRMAHDNMLFVRLASPAQNHFTRTIQSLLFVALRVIGRSSNGAWIFHFVHAYNGERDAEAETTVGTHRPDLNFIFKLPGMALTNPRGRRRRRLASQPAIIIEVCSDHKFRRMPEIARHYMAGGRGAVRTVVAINASSGTFSVWRYLRFLPTRVDGREFRRCFHTEVEVPWRGHGAQDLVLRARDFMPTKLPTVDDMEEGEMEAMMRIPVTLSAARLTTAWETARRIGWASGQVDDDDDLAGSTVADEDDLATREDPESDMEPASNEEREDGKEGEETGNVELDGSEENDEEDEDEDEDDWRQDMSM